MEINTNEELVDVLNFYFSKDVKSIKTEDKNEIEECMKKAIEKIKNSNKTLEDIAKAEFFKKNIDDEFCGNPEKICFIIKELPDNRKINVLMYFFELKKNLNKSYKKLLFEMLDSIDDEMKEKALSKANVKMLLKLMSEFNEKASSWTTPPKRKAYFKKYYEICKNAIQLKNAK